MTGLPHDDSLKGKIVRLPSISSKRRQRVLVDGVVELDEDSILVVGNLLYRADNPTYEGSSRGRFVTVIKPDYEIVECD